MDFTYLSGNLRKHFHHFRSSNLNFNLDSAYLDRDLVGLIIHGIIHVVMHFKLGTSFSRL